MWDLVPWPGIEPSPLALGAWSLSHWTTREVPIKLLKIRICGKYMNLSYSAAYSMYVHTAMPCLLLSRVWLFATPWTVAHQALLSMGFSRQEYWSGLPCFTPGDLPNSGIESVSLDSLASEGRFFTTSATWEVLQCWPKCKLFLE